MYLRYSDIPQGIEERPAIVVPPAPSVRPAPEPRRAPAPTLPTVNLYGTHIHAINEKQTIQHVLEQIDAGVGGVVVTVNLDYLRRCVSDVSFGALVAEADLIVPDGTPLIWASRIQGTPLPERVAGSDLIWSLSEAAGKRGNSIYLLGGAPGTADAAAKI